jgi:hypothetical protein
MKSWMKGILTLILALAIIGGAAGTSFAVYGDGAGDGGQLRDSSGKPMAHVTVQITQQNADGQGQSGKQKRMIVGSFCSLTLEGRSQTFNLLTWQLNRVLLLKKTCILEA